MSGEEEQAGSGLALRRGLLKRAARALPGGELLSDQLERMEQRLLAELQQRLDDLKQHGGGASAADSSADRLAGVTPQARFNALLERALEQSREQAREELFGQVVNELVADEARIIAALSDGTAHALLQVTSRKRLRTDAEPLLDNLCAIGKAAGVKLVDQVPSYIGHLLEMGLLEVGPEDRELEIKYQVLEASSEVTALSLPESSLRMQRETLLLSAFGAQFWDAMMAP